MLKNIENPPKLVYNIPMDTREFTTDTAQNGLRVDAAIASIFDDLSRARIQRHILSGNVTVNKIVITSKKHIIQEGDLITISIESEVNTKDLPQEMPLDIQYEDQDLFIINKPQGLVVHPGAGQPDSTLLNAIIAKLPSNSELPQAGLIHRLDKDTTGLLIIAKSPESYFKLNQQMANREIKREYIALVKGVLHKGGTIDAPLARHHTHRQKFTTHPNGKSAITHYEIIERFPHHTLLRVNLETGRTHQIRVHMQSIHHPIVGDKLYNQFTQMKKNTLDDSLLEKLHNFKRQALHAAYLTFMHPINKQTISVKAPLPQDFDTLLEALRS